MCKIFPTAPGGADPLATLHLHDVQIRDTYICLYIIRLIDVQTTQFKGIFLEFFPSTARRTLTPPSYIRYLSCKMKKLIHFAYTIIILIGNVVLRVKFLKRFAPDQAGSFNPSAESANCFVFFKHIFNDLGETQEENDELETKKIGC